METEPWRDRVISRRGFLVGLAAVSTTGCLRSASDTDPATPADESPTRDGNPAGRAGDPTATPETTTGPAQTDQTTATEPDSESWPTFGANSGGRGTKDVTSPGDNLTQLWSFDLRSECGNPAIANETVYVVGRTDIYALDALSGEESWSFEIGLTDPISPAPTVVEETVYATPGDGYIYAWTASDGTLQWSAGLTDGNGPTRISPRRAGDYLVVGDGGRLAGTKRGSEELEWTISLDSTIAGLVTDDEQAYVTTMHSDEANLYALDVSTGDIQWRDTGFRRPSLPAVHNGVVYTGGSDDVSSNGDSEAVGPVSALDAATGEEVWATQLDAPIRTSPVVGDDTIYVHDFSGAVHGLDVESGAVRWSEQVHNKGNLDHYPLQTGAPALVGDYLYVPAFDGQLIVVDPADGSTVSTVEIGDQLFCSPAIAGGRLVVGDSDTKSRLFAFD